jgi:hypothetical protein
MAEEFNVLEAEPLEELSWVAMPGEEACPAEGSPEQAAMRAVPYLSLLMSLAWVADATRKDALWGVNYLKQFCKNPGLRHYEAAQRVLAYLKSTPFRGVMFRRGASLEVKAWCDANWVGSTGGRSTSGVAIVVAGGVVMAASHKQASVAMSSFESELFAASGAAKMVLAARTTMRFLGAEQGRTVLHCDNRSTVAFAKSPSWNGRTRHLSVRWFLLDLLAEEGVLDLEWVSGEENAADLWTKPVARGTFAKHVKALGFVDLEVTA